LGAPGRKAGALPQAKWFTFEAISNANEREGLAYAFGKPMRAEALVDRARLIMSIGSDFLDTEQGAVGASADWARNRAIGDIDMAMNLKSQPDPKASKFNTKMSRLYAAESILSLTGSNADHRVRLTPVQMDAFGAQIAMSMVEINGIRLPGDLVKVCAKLAKTPLPTGAIEMARAFALDIQNTLFDDIEGALIVVGRNESPFLHNLAAALNHKAVTSRDSLVRYYDDVSRPEFVGGGQRDQGDFANLKAVTDLLNAGKVDTVIILGGNPVYHAPLGLGFDAALKNAKHVVVLSDQNTETTRFATLTTPRAHFLEAWGDTISMRGDSAVQQPLIQPLFGAWSEVELLLRLQGKKPDGQEAVRATWKPRIDIEDFDTFWAQCLANGLMGLDKLRPVALDGNQGHQGLGALARTVGRLKAPTLESLDLMIISDSNLYDGRFATNSVLQEAPDPITKLTWDNAVLVGPTTAKALGIEKPSQIGHTATERVEITATVDGKEVTLDLPVWIVPGMADNTLAIAMGYGRDFDSYLPYHDAGKIGVSASALRSVSSPYLVQGVSVKKTGRMYPMACVQRFDSQTPGQGYSERPIVRETTVEGFLEDPLFAAPGIIEHGHYPTKTVGEGAEQKKLDYMVAHPPTETLHAPPAKGADYTQGYQWAMVVDLNKCTGCNACLVACVTENNIPSVGKNEVRHGRELHWMRMDRYYVGDEADPAVVHLPVSCSQCETAPCENVCPVGATTHSPEGLNDMAYNRCIGTRYCSNNCPFKVRRFNFYNYSSSSSSWEGLKIRDDSVVDVKTEDQLLFMTRNPDVSVRFRGVMEKCTYCVQRINRAKIAAKHAKDAARSEAEIQAIQPACQQVCSSDCITFGDKNNPNSAVSKARSNLRNYQLLIELNLRSRTTYLGKVRNPSLNMKKG
jgi:molybdopterin-containing oxidoreductase family iron-sulfur binding subunit